MGSADEAPSTVRCTEAEALVNVAAVLRLCQAGKLTCSAATHRPSAATVRAVADVLVADDFYPDDAIAAFAWPLLLQAGGLARLDGARLALTPRGRSALGRPAAEVVRAIWERWPRHAPIDELSRVEQIKGQKAAAALSAAGPRRAAAVAALAHCPPGKWIGVDALFAVLRRTEPRLTIARSERGLWKLYIADPEYGSLGYAGYHDWPVLEGRYVLAVLFEYAATLGLVDVEYVPPAHARDDFRDMWGADWIDALSRYDGLQAVRLTPLGAYAAGLAPTYVPAAPAVPDRGLQVLANFDVVALADLPPGDRLVLDAFATRTADRVWTLSTASLLSAINEGRAPGELATFLAERAVNGVPPVVRTLLEDVATRAGRVRDLGLHRVVECADAQVATLLERDRTLRGLCTRVGERHLVIDPAGEARARAALLKLGYPLGAASR
ncbi:Helicase conserved C-terminal domain-containing protein [Modestobacter sp. DSM 44400]|uniref:helicase-associated domain-containing protein n=1 Tax=Modestobacter sp. DSM 44400 TaxID=1550230 RepID=UPI00089BFF67|nr:helicase-associated domain-containing protein [Modestobacter sp. DSM 44400]SDY77400.1 Helicase conserved C-terminal domain-containing protein [Modestobacter sp. DSM 44400]